MGSHLPTKTPHGPATGIDAAVISTPQARDEVETQLETTGKEVLSKLVKVNNSSIQDSWTHKKIKKNKPFPTATEASSLIQQATSTMTRPTQTSTLQ